MAKVSLTKLGLKVNQDIQIIDFNEQDIEIKQYLPVNEKLMLPFTSSPLVVSVPRTLSLNITSLLKLYLHS